MVTRVGTKPKGKNSQFSVKLVQVSETLVVGFGTRNPFFFSLFIEEVACANSPQYKVA